MSSMCNSRIVTILPRIASRERRHEMSDRDFHRIEVSSQVDDGRLSIQNDANLLDATRRQMFRLLKTYRTERRDQARGKCSVSCCDYLNNTPRNRLGCKTPAEVMSEKR